MSGSRRILLALLLASVTCVVVVQVSLDSWNSGAALPYPDNGLKSERSQPLAEKESKANLPKTPVITKRTTLLTSNASSPTAAPKSTTMSLKLAASSSSIKIRTASKVRRLPLSSNSRTKDQMLVNRHDRIQEILRHSGAMRARVSVDPMRSLKSMPTVDPQNVTRILVVTYFRSGSSFFGDLLQQNWKTFYQFEPLHSMTYDSRISDNRSSEAFRLINGIFRCNYTDLKGYLNWVRQPRNQFLFAHNMFLWATCRSGVKTCFNPVFVDAVCSRAPVHVMKVTRLHMRQLKVFLEANQDLNIKVVYLTRDPRGIVSSRWNLDWCNGTQCSDPGVLCREMAQDIEVFEDLKSKEPSKFVKVRFEDLSLNPEAESKRLFQFLNLPFSQSVVRFLKTHTVSKRTDNKNPYSTRRNSTAMAFSWRERFTFDQVQSVQSTCNQVLRNLNHSLITSPNQLPFPKGKPKKNQPAKSVQKEEQSNRLKSSSFRTNTGNNLTALAIRIRNESINDSKSSATYVKDKTKTALIGNGSPLAVLSSNNTKIEIHKAYYILQDSLPKNESKPIEYFPGRATLVKR